MSKKVGYKSGCSGAKRGSIHEKPGTRLVQKPSYYTPMEVWLEEMNTRIEKEYKGYKGIEEYKE